MAPQTSIKAEHDSEDKAEPHMHTPMQTHAHTNADACTHQCRRMHTPMQTHAHCTWALNCASCGSAAPASARSSGRLSSPSVAAAHAVFEICCGDSRGARRSASDARRSAAMPRAHAAFVSAPTHASAAGPPPGATRSAGRAPAGDAAGVLPPPPLSLLPPAPLAGAPGPPPLWHSVATAHNVIDTPWSSKRGSWRHTSASSADSGASCGR
eukprot:364118-Chlamydomonas_euryale.AAC.5